MKVLLSTATIVAISVTSLLAQDISNKVEKESFSHNQRIEILKEADECIKNAQSKAQYRECELKEKESRKALKGKMKGMNLSEAKQRILSRLDSRMAKLQEAKECVTNAQTKDELRACKPRKEKHRKQKRD